MTTQTVRIYGPVNIMSDNCEVNIPKGPQMLG